MSRSRRRDEWDRWGRLLALVDARTRCGDDSRPVRPVDFWPPELVPAGTGTAGAAAAVRRPRIDIHELTALMLHGRPRGF